jgi:hypothetical protein
MITSLDIIDQLHKEFPSGSFLLTHDLTTMISGKKNNLTMRKRANELTKKARLWNESQVDNT